MIGDPLLPSQRPITPPGVQHHNPAHRAVRGLLVALCATVVAVAVYAWVTRDEMPQCVDLPIGAEYHGFDDSWWVDGHLIGYSDQEDSECIRPV
jgi:hypothetical protein